MSTFFNVRLVKLSLNDFCQWLFCKIDLHLLPLSVCKKCALQHSKYIVLLPWTGFNLQHGIKALQPITEISVGPMNTMTNQRHLKRSISQSVTTAVSIDVYASDSQIHAVFWYFPCICWDTWKLMLKKQASLRRKFYLTTPKKSTQYYSKCQRFVQCELTDWVRHCREYAPIIINKTWTRCRLNKI